MWPADPPSRTVVEALTASTGRIRDNELRKRLRSEAVSRALQANSDAFGLLVERDELHDLEAASFGLPLGVSGAEMQWLYEQHFARARSSGRPIYDVLIMGTLNGLCAYCRGAQAKTLDHFCPKSLVGELAIEPRNLVPACPRCNHLLGDDWPASADQAYFHPYNVPELGRWLHASVVQVGPAVVEFRCSPESGLSTSLKARMLRQFGRLELGELFAVLSSAELSHLRNLFIRNRWAGGQVHEYLDEVASAAFAYDGNDRRAVLYEALSLSEWYCDGGFAA